MTIIRQKSAAIPSDVFLTSLRRLESGQSVPLPFVGDISAGFPSPADDYAEQVIDLNKELVKHPDATFYGRVKGQSMRDLGMDNGDILVVDRSLQATNGRVVVCFLDGEFTVKTLQTTPKGPLLVPANSDYPVLKIEPENQFLVWGVVTYVIKKMKL